MPSPGAASTVGFVAAGGRSLRMGRDKAALPWAGGTLLDHALARLRAVTPDVRILSGAGALEGAGAPALADLRPEAGPLGALEAALHALRGGGAALLLGVDLPFVPVPLLAALRDADEGADAVVPSSTAGPEPLCALYRASCAGAVARALDAGERRMTAFWPQVRVTRLDPRFAAQFGDPSCLFRNVNTPADYDAAMGTGA